jgi:hypothetical protein
MGCENATVLPQPAAIDVASDHYREHLHLGIEPLTVSPTCARAGLLHWLGL